jgi:hypothetical protein
MAQLSMPPRPLPTEPVVQLYNQCRAHVVLLVELESKLKKLEYEKSLLLQRKMGGPSAAPSQQSQPPPSSHGAKRARDSHHGSSNKRSHH